MEEVWAWIRNKSQKKASFSYSYGCICAKTSIY